MINKIIVFIAELVIIVSAIGYVILTLAIWFLAIVSRETKERWKNERKNNSM